MSRSIRRLFAVRSVMPATMAFAIAVAVPALPAHAQEDADTSRTREVDVSADLLEEAVVAGERVRRLSGDVRLRQGETRLWSTRAIQYLDRREILFIGNVLVVERGDTLRADSVLYNRSTKVGRATGDVRLSDGDVLVTAPSGLYFTRQKRAQFSEGVQLVDSTAVLTSEAGEYWSDEKRAEFFGDVQLDEERTHLEADSVTYLRETDVSIARGNVFIERSGAFDDSNGEREEGQQDDGLQDDGQDEGRQGVGQDDAVAEAEADTLAQDAGDQDGIAGSDSLTRTLLFGEYAYNEDSTAYSRIEGTPLLVQLRQDSVGAEIDTLLIRAAVLESSREDSLQRLVAIDSVRIWQRDLAAVADSVVYDRFEVEEDSLEEEVRLFGSPMAWLQQNQVSGDTMLVKARDDAVDSLYVRSTSFVARQDSSIQRIHQLRGRNLDAAFEGDSLRALSIGPQAEAINFRSDDDGNPSGAVRMSADRIIFRFRGDDLDRLEAIRGTEGTYYPEELVPDGLQLEGFAWYPERMPTKAGLLGPIAIPVRRPEVAQAADSFHAGTSPTARTEPSGTARTK